MKSRFNFFRADILKKMGVKKCCITDAPIKKNCIIMFQRGQWFFMNPNAKKFFIEALPPKKQKIWDKFVVTEKNYIDVLNGLL